MFRIKCVSNVLPSRETVVLQMLHVAVGLLLLSILS